AQPCHDLIGGDLALGEWFERYEHATSIDCTGVATHESDHILYCWVGADNVHELAQDLLHLLERTALIGLKRADESASVLLGEEGLRNNHGKIDGEANRCQGYQQDQELLL